MGKRKNSIVVSGDTTQYFPAVNKAIQYKGMRVEKPRGIKKIATAGPITISHELKRIHFFLQDPYTSTQKQRAESAARRNWPIRSAISVRAHFMFGKGSELSIELSPTQAAGLDAKGQAAKVIQVFSPFRGSKLFQIYWAGANKPPGLANLARLEAGIL